MIQKHIIKFYEIMLPPHLTTNNLPDSHLCECSVFNLASPQESNQIFLTKNRTNRCFSGQFVNDNAKTFQNNKQKLSLKLNKGKRLKQNVPVVFLTSSDETYDKTPTKTDVITRTDSQNLRFTNEYFSSNQYSCFSSQFFKESAFIKQKDVFRRLLTEIEITELTEKTKNEVIPLSRSSRKLNAQNKGLTSNRQKKQSFGFVQTKAKVMNQNQRHARSESGQQFTPYLNFYSQQHLINYTLNEIDMERQVSSIVLKKKTSKRKHRLEELNFRDTESIIDQQSESDSVVISEESDFRSENGQFSQIEIPRQRCQRFSAIPKTSNFK